MPKKIVNHTDLEVYKRAIDCAMEVFQLSKAFPTEERYSMTDQVRRSSRSVCANLAEAWRRRRYEAAFINKLNEAEGEAAETQVWIELAVKCKYLEATEARDIYTAYANVLRTLVGMINHPETWIISDKKKR